MPHRNRRRTATADATSINANDDETASLYLALLQSSHPTAEGLRSQGFPQDQLDEQLPILMQRGMIQAVDEESWYVVPPEVAMPAYAAALEDRARLVRATTQAMSRVYVRTQSERRLNPDVGILPLTSLVEVTQALHQVTSTAQSWVLSSRTDSPLSRYLLDAPRAISTTPFLNSQGEPLHVRLDIDPALMTDDNASEIMHARASAGDEIRLTAGMPFTGAVNDRGLAMIDLKDRGGTPVGVLMNFANGGDVVRDCLEFAWRLGVPWRPADDPASERDMLDSRDRRILRLMANGVSDAAISRQIGISSRTVERRVRVIMDRVNATTRFQAGVLAARQGLI
ncbi:helix-turn-helix transcriptional regulator [Flexivirga meconopsidis]|uniref:helix-turn-helix transcriptional regulator n=1 Tax=Flexivirga meconopsidis TaxID=2977121 RepID=UPI002240288A